MYEQYRNHPIDHDYLRDEIENPRPEFRGETLIIPDVWKWDNLLNHGLMLSTETHQESPHQAGGTPIHDNAVCPHCCLPLWQVLNIDLGAVDIPKPLAEELNYIDRLPIYYCPRCPVETSYRFVPEGKIQVLSRAKPGFDYRTYESEETPFAAEQDPPVQLESRRLELKSIPCDIHEPMIRVWNTRCGLDVEVTDADKEAVLDWSGTEDVYDLPISQLFGCPIFPQGHDQESCINPECPLSYDGVTMKFRGEHSPETVLLRPLAFVSSELIPEFHDYYTGVTVQLCWCCHTISTNYECA